MQAHPVYRILSHFSINMITHELLVLNMSIFGTILVLFTFGKTFSTLGYLVHFYQLGSGFQGHGYREQSGP